MRALTSVLTLTLLAVRIGCAERNGVRAGRFDCACVVFAVPRDLQRALRLRAHVHRAHDVAGRIFDLNGDVFGCRAEQGTLVVAA